MRAIGNSGHEQIKTNKRKYYNNGRVEQVKEFQYLSSTTNARGENSEAVLCAMQILHK